MVDKKGIVELSVGGVNHSTTKGTLTKDKGSKLYRMFADGEDLMKLDSGKYFIDRDGECFKYVLEYLRNPDEEYINYDAERTNKILKEALFFGLKGFEKNIREALPVLTQEVLN